MGAGDIYINRELTNPIAKRQRQTIDIPIALLYQRFRNAQHHTFHPLCGNRVDPQLETISLRDFKQTGIDSAANHILKHRLTLGFFHWHRIAQGSVHIHRKSNNALTIEQRKLQLTFQHAPVRVVERHVDFGPRVAATHVTREAHRLQLHRRIRRRGNDEARRRPDLYRRGCCGSEG